MPCVSLQKKPHKFQDESSDLETQLFELEFLCENINTIQHSLIDPSRYRFLNASVKPNVSWFGKYNWFTRKF